MTKTITQFRATPYTQGKGSYVVVIPKSKFSEELMQADKEYNFIVQEINTSQEEEKEG